LAQSDHRTFRDRPSPIDWDGQFLSGNPAQDAFFQSQFARNIQRVVATYGDMGVAFAVFGEIGSSARQAAVNQ